MVSHGFPEFRPGDNPYDLGRGAVRELAALSGIELSAEPDDSEIQEQLFVHWGREKEFRTNADQYQARLGNGPATRTQIANLIGQSGIMESFEPRRIDGVMGHDFRRLVIGAGVYNWMHRRAKLAVELIKEGHRFDGAVLLASGREMSSETEQNVEWVRAWREEHNGASPTEKDYMHDAVARWLAQYGIRSEEVFDDNPKAGFRQLAAEAKDLLDGGEVMLSQNSPASYTFGDMRGIVPDDSLYFAADSIALARTDRQETKPSHYQKVFSAPSALARWVKTVHDINTGMPA